MGISEIEAAIMQLPRGKVEELAEWFERHRAQLEFDSIDDERFTTLIDEAYESGEPAPLTQGEIDTARETVKKRIRDRAPLQ